eukprot:s3639_g6.t1
MCSGVTPSLNIVCPPLCPELHASSRTSSAVPCGGRFVAPASALIHTSNIVLWTVRPAAGCGTGVCPPTRATAFHTYLYSRRWAWQHVGQLGEASNSGPRPGKQATLDKFFSPCNRTCRQDTPAPLTPDRSLLDERPTVRKTSPTGATDCNTQLPAGTAEPCDDTFQVAVVNPTSVLNKHQQLLATGADILCVSETSAVLKAQHIVSSKLRASKFGVVWSPPVASHCHQEQEKTSLRGCALGAAVMSRFPVRPPFQAVPQEVQASQRIAVAHARLGPLHVRCIAVYGWPANHSDARARNDELMCQVLKLVSDGGSPVLIGGDFNTAPQALGCWQSFLRLGYREVFQMWKEKFQITLPATCRGATRHDTMLLPPVLADLALTARVKRVNQQLANEWKAITKASGYGTWFPSWLLQCAHFHVYYAEQQPHPFVPPAQDWVQDVLEFVQFDCDVTVKQEARHRAKLAKHAVHVDIADGHSRQGYAALRPQAKPPFTAIPWVEKQVGRLVESPALRSGRYQTPDPKAFRADLPITADSGAAVFLGVCENDRHGPLLQLELDSPQLPDQVELAQVTEASTATELNRAFTLFWHPIWTRDRGAALQDVATWDTFLAHLPAAPDGAIPCPLNLDDVDMWRASARRLRTRSATGYCGFSNAELKWLPDTPLRHLVQLFKLCTKCGFPHHFGRATVSVLAKVDILPQGMHHGRPITVFSNLYRFWASTCARAVLRHWSTWLPASVSGSVPGRSARDVSMCIECHVEQALLRHEPLAGFSLDIIKCFNQVPRAPMRQLLLHLGLPAALVETWMSFLASITRHTVFHESLGLPIGSTTGLPEGCPLSVVGMVALCWYLSALPRAPDVSLHTYVDNWSWVAKSAASMLQSIATAISFCNCLKLPIDWTKSFAWATTKRLRVWLQTDAQNALPNGASLTVVSHAKDLGVHYRFRATTGNPQAQQRIHEACRRLDQLQPLRRPLFNKARLIQASVWPATFYGCEGRLLPVNTVNRLRSAAARAFIGLHSSASPFLALAAITPHLDDPEVYLLSSALCAVSRLLRLKPLEGNICGQSHVGPFTGSSLPAVWQPDTKEHRLLHCPAAAEVRRPFLGLLEQVQQHRRHWLHCPYPAQPEDVPLLRLIWQSRALPGPPCEVNLLHNFRNDCLRLFTDGSCSHPEVPTARHASWAVLLYTGPEPVEPELLLARWRGRALSSIFFHVVAQGVVPGEQTISRAEFIALSQASQVAQQRPDLAAHIWSDSATALRAASLVQQHGPPAVPAFARDLLDATADNHFPRLHQLHKVKAHVCPSTVATDSVLPTLGNELADAAAKEARKADLELVVEACDRVSAENSREIELLQMFSQYQLELAKKVKSLKAGTCFPAAAIERAVAADQQVFLKRWSEMSTAGHCAAWSADPRRDAQDNTTACDRWLRQLWWSDPDSELHRYSGITYLELLVNFVLVTASLPPRTVKDPVTKKQTVVELTDKEGILLPANLRDMLSAFSILVARACKRCTWNPLQHKHRKISSLVFLGIGKPRKGLLRRPALPREQETGEQLFKVLCSSSPGEALRDLALSAL